MRLIFTYGFIFFAQFVSAQVFDNASFRLVNSVYDEQNPVLSPDGKTLYFTLSNHPENIGGKKDPGDIWFSKRVGNEWSSPVHAGRLVNDRAYNAVAGFSSDGGQLFLHGHYDPTGATAKTQGLSVSAHSGIGWSRPVNITIPYYLNRSPISNGSVTADNSVFIFSAETYGTYGVEDIYVSINSAGKWSEPRNLGSTINTRFQELSPFLSADGKTLYFSSNGRRGSGSFDIYYATRLDDTWTNWSAPVNMGEDINSPGRDLYFRDYPDKDFSLYTSTINSDGYGDIRMYRADKPPLKDTVIVTMDVPADTVAKTVAEVRPDTMKTGSKVEINVYGKVTNSKTGEPVAAKITVAGPGIAEKTTTSDGTGYNIYVPTDNEYILKIEAHEFVSVMEKLNVNAYEMDELEMNFKLQPVEVGTTVNLKNVLFAQTKADILPESYPELDLVVNFLQANPTVRIELSGHTDNRGIPADNVRLSHQRVNKVKEYLVSKGVDAKRIVGRGYGGSKPIASNDTEESRRMNRRVEFIIKKF